MTLKDTKKAIHTIPIELNTEQSQHPTFDPGKSPLQNISSPMFLNQVIEMLQALISEILKESQPIQSIRSSFSSSQAQPQSLSSSVLTSPLSISIQNQFSFSISSAQPGGINQKESEMLMALKEEFDSACTNLSKSKAKTIQLESTLRREKEKMVEKQFECRILGEKLQLLDKERRKLASLTMGILRAIGESLRVDNETFQSIDQIPQYLLDNQDLLPLFQSIYRSFQVRFSIQ